MMTNEIRVIFTSVASELLNNCIIEDGSFDEVIIEDDVNEIIIE